jgi:hypothetical protein
LKSNRLYTALLLAVVLSSAAFAQSEKKTAFGVLIDNTGSLRSQFDFVKALGKGVIERIHQRGPVSLFNFNTRGDAPNGTAAITYGIERSRDKAALDTYIDGLRIIPGITTLFDAIYTVAEIVDAGMNLDRDAFSGKAIILITDGEDRASKIKDKQLIEKLKESGIKVYAIALVSELDSVSGLLRKSQRAKAEDFFRKVTKETGGRVVYATSNKAKINSLLDELFTETRPK